MAFQPPYRNKTHGFPATTLQKQNTWLSSHPTETKHMAFQPPLYRNKTHGFPATLQKQNTWLSSHHPTETKHMAFQPPLPETEVFFPKRYGWSLWKCLLRGLWLSSQCKIQRFRPPISSFQLRQYPSWHHSEACPSASLQLSHSSSHP